MRSAKAQCQKKHANHKWRLPDQHIAQWFLFASTPFVHFYAAMCNHNHNGSNAVCDSTGIIIIPNNCSSLHRLSLTKFNVFKSKLPYVRFLTESADVMKETIDKLNSNLHFQECQLQSLFTSLYSLVLDQYSGQVLSAFVGKPTAAITVGDVLTKNIMRANKMPLYCITYNMVTFFSSRSLVQIPLPNFTSRIGQIYRDGNAYFGVRLIEKFVPGRTSTCQPSWSKINSIPTKIILLSTQTHPFISYPSSYQCSLWRHWFSVSNPYIFLQISDLKMSTLFY